MPQTSTAAQWQGPVIVGNPPMMVRFSDIWIKNDSDAFKRILKWNSNLQQMPYPSAYPTAYPTPTTGMPGPPQAGQQFAQNMQQQQQQSLMSGAGPGVNQQGGPPAGSRNQKYIF